MTEQVAIYDARPYNQPDIYKNLPFNPDWLTLDDLPFGLEDWALEFLEPRDFATGVRTINGAFTSSKEPSLHNFRVKREANGRVDIQYDVDADTYFSLRHNSAVVIRRGPTPLTMAKYMPFLGMNHQRHWRQLWERKVVHNSVAPLAPATNGASFEYLCDCVRRLARKYECDFDLVAVAFDPKRIADLKTDDRETDVHYFRMLLDFYDMELRLRQNAMDLTQVQKLAEFHAFGFKCKSIRAKAAAQGKL